MERGEAEENDHSYSYMMQRKELLRVHNGTKHLLKSVCALVMALVMTVSLLPVEVMAAQAAEPQTKTVTFAAVKRTAGDPVAQEMVVEPTKVTVYEGTGLRYLIDDLTGVASTYQAGGGTWGGRLYTIAGEPKNLLWRGFTKSADGVQESYINVRDREIRDGDTVVLATLVDSSESFESLPADLQWPENVTASADLTVGVAEALERQTAEQLFPGVDLGAVTENLTLPGKITEGGVDYRADWHSSDKEVLSDSGKITRPRDGRDASAQLTLTVRDGVSKTFPVTVKAYSADEAAVENVKDLVGNFNYIKGENASASKIISDLHLPTAIEGYEGVSIQWTSSHPEVLESSGVVHRPANSASDVRSIKLTAVISKGGYEVTVEHKNLSVLKITTYEVNLDKDVQWLEEVWAPKEGLKQDLELPAAGEPGKSKIRWETSDPSVITEEGVVIRGEAGEEAKSATLTATLTAGNYSQSFTRVVEISVTVLPFTQEEYEAKLQKIQALTDLVESMELPDTVDSDNQAAVTEKVRPMRASVQAAYDEAIAAGAKADELSVLEAYRQYLNVETALRRLPKTITVSVIDAVKNGAGDYTVGPGYFLEKTKVVAEGSKDGKASNEIGRLMTDLKNADCLGEKPLTGGNLSLNMHGQAIKADGGYTWHYAVNGVDGGTFSGNSSHKDQMLDHGDVLVLFFAKDGEERFTQGDYAVGLPSEAPVEYDFDNSELFDASLLTDEKILGENESRYAVTEDLNLPGKGKCGTKIEWTSSNPAVIAEDGKVTRPDVISSDAAVVLTAEVGDQIRVFNLTVLSLAESTDDKTLAYAAEQLVLPGLEAVKSDLSLPAKGFGGVAITWKSGNTAVIGDDGVVVRPAEKTDVVLTATLTKGERSITKDFTATVLPAARDDLAVVSYDKVALTFEAIRGENLAEGQIIADLRLPAQGVMGSAIRWTSDNGGAISDKGAVHRTDADQAVVLTAAITYGTATESVSFQLTVPALTPADHAKSAAIEALAALPEAVTVDYTQRKTATDLLARAVTVVGDAEKAGVEVEALRDYARLDALRVKLERLPVEMTFSMLGAEVRNEKMTAYKWFVPKEKLLVPKGSNLSDITKAVVEDFEFVRPGTGDSYYGAFFGLGEFDAGRGSGWIFGGVGEGIDPSQGCAASVPGQGSVAAWQFIGDWDPTIPQPDAVEKYELIIPLGDDHPVDRNLVPPTDAKALEELIAQAESLWAEDFRDYGPWSGTWEKMESALADARRVDEARDTALSYEVDAALAGLRYALNQLQPVELDTAELGRLVEEAKRLREEDFYPAGWEDLQPVLAAAEKALNDPYAEHATISQLTVELQTALDRLIPTTQADKTMLQQALDITAQRTRENYTYASWQRLEAARAHAQAVLEDVDATQEESDEAARALQKAVNSLMKPESSGLKEGNRVVYQAIADWQGTQEPWEIMDMVLLGRGADVNEYGFLIDVAQLLADKRVSFTDLERTTIALTSLGYDATDITMADGTKHNLIERIEAIDANRVTVNALTFALVAVDSGHYEAADLRERMVDALVAVQNEDGGWPIYAGSASDLDMTAMTMSALAPYMSDSRVDGAMRKAAEVLVKNKNMISSNPGTYGGNANTAAVSWIAAMAVPQLCEDVLSGFKYGGLSYYITAENRLGYKDDKTANALATEQGVRAYAVYNQFTDTQGTPVNAYQFPAPTRAVILPEAELPVITTDLMNQATDQASIRFQASAVTPDEREAEVQVTVNGAVVEGDGTYEAALDLGVNTIVIEAASRRGAVTTAHYTVMREEAMVGTMSVNFTLTGDTHHYDAATGEYTGAHSEPVWIPETEVLVPVGATAEYVTEMMLIQSQLSYTLENGYLSEVNGLGAFDNGPNSGWMFTCNGKLTAVGISGLTLHEGDSIRFFYSDDYTKETGDVDEAVGQVILLINAIELVNFQVTMESEPSIVAARTAYDALTEAQKLDVSNYGSLVWAEGEMAALKAVEADKAAALAVDEMIAAIGTVTLDSADQIREAREAYEALTGSQQQWVENLSVLEAAEAALEQLQNPPVEPEEPDQPQEPEEPGDKPAPEKPDDKPVPDEKPGDNEQPEGENPDTGDTAALALYAVAGLAAAGAFLALEKKKRMSK